MNISKEKLIDFYKQMNLIRKLELKIIDLAAQGEIYGNLHMGIGQEAIAVGAMAALERRDVITSAHRGIAHIIGKGGDPKKILAELMGKKTGYCQGRAGKMHIAAPDIGMMGAHGIVGSGIPLAVGMGLYIDMFKTGQVAVSFFGDGAVNHGYFHESLNLASLWRLPVLFICENNLYAISTRIEEAMACKSLSFRAKAYNISGIELDGNDVIEVYNKVGEIVNNTRKGKGPVLIDAKTYRFRGHHERDNQNYRSKEEIEMWKKKCPIKRLKNILIRKYSWSEEEEKQLTDEINHTITEAVNYSIGSPYPNLEEIEKYVFI